MFGKLQFSGEGRYHQQQQQQQSPLYYYINLYNSHLNLGMLQITMRCNIYENVQNFNNSFKRIRLLLTVVIL